MTNKPVNLKCFKLCNTIPNKISSNFPPCVRRAFFLAGRQERGCGGKKAEEEKGGDERMPRGDGGGSARDAECATGFSIPWHTILSLTISRKWDSAGRFTPVVGEACSARAHWR